MLDKHSSEPYRFGEFLYFLSMMAFAIAFGILTGDFSYYSPCSTSTSAYKWSSIVYLYNLIAILIVAFILQPIYIFRFKNHNYYTEQKLEKIIMIIRSLVVVMGLISYAGLCYAYAQDESCGKLSQLVKAFVIYFSVVLGSLACGGCCFGIIHTLQNTRGII